MRVIRMMRREDFFQRRTLKEININTLTTLTVIFIALPILLVTGPNIIMKTEKL